MPRITDHDVKQGACLFLARVLARDPKQLDAASILVDRRMKEWRMSTGVVNSPRAAILRGIHSP